jgi:hypothetical protein
LILISFGISNSLFFCEIYLEGNLIAKSEAGSRKMAKRRASREAVEWMQLNKDLVLLVAKSIQKLQV